MLFLVITKEIKNMTTNTNHQLLDLSTILPLDLAEANKVEAQTQVEFP